MLVFNEAAMKLAPAPKHCSKLARGCCAPPSGRTQAQTRRAPHRAAERRICVQGGDEET